MAILAWLLLAVLALTGCGEQHKEEPAAPVSLVYNVVREWGTPGRADGAFDGVQGLTVDREDRIYAADAENCRVQVFDRDGRFLRAFGACGKGLGELLKPVDVAVDSAGFVYVADFLLDRIVVFDAKGNYARQWGRTGAGEGQFSSPVGIAIDADGSVFVTGFYNHRVQKFSARGEFLTQFGHDGSGDGELHYPGKLTTAGGSVYVADAHNSRIMKFSNTGQFEASLGFGHLYEPMDVAVDRDGRLHIADSGSRRVKLLTPQGEFVTEWNLPDQPESSFQSPASVTINSRGFLYASDIAGNRIYELELSKGEKK